MCEAKHGSGGSRKKALKRKWKPKCENANHTTEANASLEDSDTTSLGNLFHSLTVLGKKDILKCSVLHLYSLILSGWSRLVWFCLHSTVPFPPWFSTQCLPYAVKFTLKVMDTSIFFFFFFWSTEKRYRPAHGHPGHLLHDWRDPLGHSSERLWTTNLTAAGHAVALLQRQAAAHHSQTYPWAGREVHSRVRQLHNRYLLDAARLCHKLKSRSHPTHHPSYDFLWDMFL